MDGNLTLATKNLFQIGWATSDIDLAAQQVARELRVPGFAIRDRTLQVDSPRGPLELNLRIGLAFAGDLMLELIQPLGDDAGVYSSTLPDSGGSTVLHHLAYRVGGSFDDWKAFRRGIDDGRILFERHADPSHLYVDTRAALGHHLEYVWLSDDRFAAIWDRVPRG